jgi:hypothetical protein
MQLVIGSKNYSSWSLRPWILMRSLDIPFNERVIPLDPPDFANQLATVYDGSTLPVLIDDDVVIWEALAIEVPVHVSVPQADNRLTQGLRPVGAGAIHQPDRTKPPRLTTAYYLAVIMRSEEKRLVRESSSTALNRGGESNGIRSASAKP